jgi:transposase InsO family protein
MNLEGETETAGMLETSTNGAGAADGVAAGSEDRRAVGELGFVAGGRAVPAGVPDPELVEQAKRRPFSAKYKLEILANADACTRPGEVGELLRREGLYTSHLTYWRKQVRDGSLKELGQPRGRKPADPRDREIAELSRRAEHAEPAAERARARGGARAAALRAVRRRLAGRDVRDAAGRGHLPVLDADDVSDSQGSPRRGARAPRSAHLSGLRQAGAAGRAAERAVVVGRLKAQGPGEVDVVLPVRDPRRVQPLRGRLDGAVPRERAARHDADRAGHRAAADHPQDPDAARRSGAPMRSKPVAFLLADLGVTKTHSRPYTSSDNPYSESNFKTLKYRPEFPARFDDIEHARAHCRRFFDWYNHAHRHSGIGLMTPAAFHHGQAPTLHARRARVLKAAYERNPERFVRKPPVPPDLPTVASVNKPDTKEVAH